MTRTQLTSIGLIAASLALPTAASGQDFMPDIELLDAQEVQALPADLRDGPVSVETGLPPLPAGAATVGPDGVETITRTRRIVRRAAPAAHTSTEHAATAYTSSAYGGGAHTGGAHTQSYGHTAGHSYGYGYPAGAQVFSRDQWLAACEDRTRGRRGKDKGGIIGGLLGAIAGGIIGNRAFDSERLGGTLLGAGVGGLGGVLLGSLIGGGRNDRGEYDCEAALDGYLSQYAHGGGQYAARSIPAQVHAVPHQGYRGHHGHHYGYSYAAPQYYYAPPQQIVYIPVEYQQRQRVVVRETVREEVIPGATRIIPAPAPQPAPRPIKTAPRPVKAAPIPIKGY